MHSCLAVPCLAVCAPATQADFVTFVTFVDGRGDIHTVDRDCFEGRGLLGGLGMLGVITEVTLKLQVRHEVPSLFEASGVLSQCLVGVWPSGHVCCCYCFKLGTFQSRTKSAAANVQL
jgi:hypothetical protein